MLSPSGSYHQCNEETRSAYKDFWKSFNRPQALTISATRDFPNDTRWSLGFNRPQALTISATKIFGYNAAYNYLFQSPSGSYHQCNRYHKFPTFLHNLKLGNCLFSENLFSAFLPPRFAKKYLIPKGHSCQEPTRLCKKL